jgi:hypothetical protein
MPQLIVGVAHRLDHSQPDAACKCFRSKIDFFNLSPSFCMKSQQIKDHLPCTMAKNSFTTSKAEHVTSLADEQREVVLAQTHYCRFELDTWCAS